MSTIRTKSWRNLNSHLFGRMRIECTFVDQEANLDTWIENCTILASEFNIPAVEVHHILFARFPELFN
jgi:hypothetical protein